MLASADALDALRLSTMAVGPSTEVDQPYRYLCLFRKIGMPADGSALQPSYAVPEKAGRYRAMLGMHHHTNVGLRFTDLARVAAQETDSDVAVPFNGQSRG